MATTGFNTSNVVGIGVLHLLVLCDRCAGLPQPSMVVRVVSVPTRQLPGTFISISNCLFCSHESKMFLNFTGRETAGAGLPQPSVVVRAIRTKEPSLTQPSGHQRQVDFRTNTNASTGSLSWKTEKHSRAQRC
ncbi:hypothetical protein J6590_071709 [Homalodisca vitripennis]|nr:hypothetical protein J6590_071709 [Homalodisca vitripennis]